MSKSKSKIEVVAGQPEVEGYISLNIVYEKRK